MNELEVWGRRSVPLVPSREQRAHAGAMTKVAHSAQETALRVDAAAAITARIFDRAAALDAQRQALAHNNPTLDAVLMRIEVGFAVTAEALQRESSGNGFRL